MEEEVSSNLTRSTKISSPTSRTYRFPSQFVSVPPKRGVVFDWAPQEPAPGQAGTRRPADGFRPRAGSSGLHLYLPPVQHVGSPYSVEVDLSWLCPIAFFVDSKIPTGKPVVRGTRISVELVVELLAAGWSHAQIPASYPHLTEEDIRACLAYASELLREEKVYPLKTA